MLFFKELESRIASAMQADRHRMRNLLKAARKAEEEGRPPDDKLEKLLKQLDESHRRREVRQALVPRLEYDETLPVVARRAEIAAAIREFQVVVVCGETGSGKSTQLPKICLEIDRHGGTVGRPRCNTGDRPQQGNPQIGCVMLRKTQAPGADESRSLD